MTRFNPTRFNPAPDLYDDESWKCWNLLKQASFSLRPTRKRK